MQYQQTKSRMSIILSAMRGKRGLYIFGLFSILVTNLADFITPQVVRFTVDSIIDDNPLPDWLASAAETIGGRDYLRHNLWAVGLIALAAVLLSALFGIFRRYFAQMPAHVMVANMRDRLFGHIQRLPFNWHVKIQTGDIIQRCTSDAQTVQNTVMNVFPEFLRACIMIIATTAIMLTMDPFMTVFALCLLPLYIVTGVFYQRVVSKTFKVSDEAEGAMQATVQENLTGVRVVRAFNRETFEIGRFDVRNGDLLKKQIKMTDLLAFFWTLGDLVGSGQLLLVIGVGAFRVSDGLLSLGTFLTFVTYTMMLMWPASATGRHISEMSKCAVSLGRLKEILDAAPEQDPENPKTPSFDADIAFENVTFAYEEGGDVLKNVSFSLKKGETLGVLGGTGSGKSTLAYLLTRLYDLPENAEGRITVGGVDIREISREYVRKNIAIVLQEPFLYSKSIMDNISTSGDTMAEHVFRAAEVASVHDTIEEFEKGYDTKVGERGVTLSGGQKQRVAIARMLVQNAPVMIFDDSLSAVDTQTDAKIRQSLKEHTADATVILISHRISTLMQADRILVLEDGRAEDIGTHEELISRENTYKRVFEIQRAVKGGEIS